MLKSPTTNKLADELIEKTLFISDEKEKKLHNSKEGDQLREKK